jgi:4-hydroxy-3-polyprenylbenzoate decarboxylase
MASPNRPNVGYADLRDMLSRIDDLGELLKIDGADWDKEIGALQEMIASRGDANGGPAVLFDNVPGSPPGFRALTAIAGSHRRTAMILGFPEDSTPIDMVSAYRDRMRDDFELTRPKMVKRGPVFENIERDDEVDLTKFPTPLLHELDGGRYIGTDDLVIIQDPDSDWVNVATYRVMLHDKNTLGIWMSPGKHGRLIREKFFAKGEPCPVAISIGHDPLLSMVAAQAVDFGTDEFAYAGGHRGRPFELTKSELHGLPIPADAEIVLEGEIYGDELRPEGPFGEFMGYYASGQRDEPIIKVRRVYYRNDPIMMVSSPGRPSADRASSLAVARSAIVWDEVEKAGLPGVKGVWCHARTFKVIAIEQLYPGHAKQAAMLATNVQSAAYAGRWTIVVDADIDPSNQFDVVWAMSTRCDPPEDIDFVRRTWSTPLDPLLREPPYHNNRAVVDACRPWGWKDDFPKVAEASPELKAELRKKWAHLFTH